MNDKKWDIERQRQESRRLACEEVERTALETPSFAPLNPTEGRAAISRPEDTRGDVNRPIKLALFTLTVPAGLLLGLIVIWLF